MTLAVILFPLAVALLLCLVRSLQTQRTLAVIGVLGTFVAALLLPGDSGVNALWIPGFEVYFSLSPEGAGSVLVLVAALMMIPTVIYAGLKVEERTGPMLALLLLMQAGLNGVFLAKDLVLFYIFWEATLIPSVLMLGIWGSPKRRQAAMKYLLYAVTSSFLMLVAILAIKPLSGAASYRLEDLLAATPTLPLETQLWLFAGFAIAFAVKLPLWPLHAWLPDFHEHNHASGVADVAGTLYKVGGWGFFAWALPLLPAAAEAAAPLLLTLAAVTALYAAVVATAQTNLKRLLAYASLSHMGMVGVGLFGLNIIGLSGAIYLLAAQMATTGGMFLLSGMLHDRKGSFDLTHFGGLARSAPALAGFTLFVLFGFIGVPGLANFPGEFMSLMGAYQTNAWLAFVATTAVIAAGVYGVNLYQRLYQGKQEHGAVADLGRLELITIIPVVIAILWLGVFPANNLEHIETQASVAVSQLKANETADTSTVLLSDKTTRINPPQPPLRRGAEGGLPLIRSALADLPSSPLLYSSFFLLESSINQGGRE